MKNIRNIAIVLFSAALLIFSSCQKNDQDNFGILKVTITDDPFPIDFIAEANVTITKVEIRTKNDTSGNPYMILMEDTLEYNLLDLRNGVVAELLELEIPVGNYDHIRLYVDKASISIIEGDTFELKVPSGSQTGIKIFIDPELRIEGGLSSELLLDFNLEKSFVLKGNVNTPAGIKGFNFKPVIRAVNNSTAGSIQGIVSDTSLVALENATVWIMQDSTIATAYTDSTGFYAMPGIPEGFYSLYSTKENHDTVMFSDVEIIAANRKIMDIILTPDI